MITATDSYSIRGFFYLGFELSNFISKFAYLLILYKYDAEISSEATRFLFDATH